MCKRCFRLKHHNDLIGQPADATTPQVLSFLKDQAPSVVVKVVDLVDFPGSFIENLKDTIGDKHTLILVGNKLDQVGDFKSNNKQSQASIDRVTKWLERYSAALGLKTRHVVAVSSKTGSGMNQLVGVLKQLREASERVYFVGCANVGKSALLNCLVTRQGTKEQANVLPTESYAPGTTTATITVPLHLSNTTEPVQLVDTPGIFNMHRIIHNLNMQELKQVVPTKLINPQSFLLLPGRSLCLGGLARLDYVKTEVDQPPVWFSFFGSNTLPLHITNPTRAEELKQEHYNGIPNILTPPLGSADRLKQFPRMEKARSFQLSSNDWRFHSHDIVLSGLGWVSLRGRFADILIDVYTLGGKGVAKRPPLVPNKFGPKLNKPRK
jgi:ribosome biogenesis GTPase A